LLQKFRAGLFAQNDEQHGGLANAGERFPLWSGCIQDHRSDSSSRIQERKTWAEISGSLAIFSRRCLARISLVLVMTGASLRELRAAASILCSMAARSASRASICWATLPSGPERAAAPDAPAGSSAAAEASRCCLYFRFRSQTSAPPSSTRA